VTQARVPWNRVVRCRRDGPRPPPAEAPHTSRQTEEDGKAKTTTTTREHTLYGEHSPITRTVHLWAEVRIPLRDKHVTPQGSEHAGAFQTWQRATHEYTQLGPLVPSVQLVVVGDADGAISGDRVGRFVGHPPSAVGQRDAISASARSIRRGRSMPRMLEGELTPSP